METYKIFICNKETPLQILYYFQITLRLNSNKMDSSKTELRSKCQLEVGSYKHCVSSFICTEEYCGEIVDKLILIFIVQLDAEPEFSSWFTQSVW